MKALLLSIIILSFIGTTNAGTILMCSSGMEYKKNLTLVSNIGKNNRYRVKGTTIFTSCNKQK